MSIWPFRRKPRYSPPQLPVLDTWRRGDLGECIGDGDCWAHAYGGQLVNGPQAGDLIRVASVHMMEGNIYLEVERFRGDFYEAGAFRKIVIQREKACSSAFARLVRRARKAVTA